MEKCPLNPMKVSMVRDAGRQGLAGKMKKSRRDPERMQGMRTDTWPKILPRNKIGVFIEMIQTPGPEILVSGDWISIYHKYQRATKALINHQDVICHSNGIP